MKSGQKAHIAYVETNEQRRLNDARETGVPWKKWGPYLSERQWGTVREDYSQDGNAWDYFSHDHARSRAYRWGEDGLAGISDDRQQLCFAIALWNGRDPILKERAFGLSGIEGNHGEDVKEYYFYLDSTPTHSYMKYLYKYPQEAFPYRQLVQENRRRNKHAPEYELMDTGVFEHDRYFDVFVEYAKASPEDVLIQIRVANRGPETAQLSLLPTIWFRNTWSWRNETKRPSLCHAGSFDGMSVVQLDHEYYGRRRLVCEGEPELLFTENDTNVQRLYGTQNASPYVKDGIGNYIVNGNKEAVNPGQKGTKAAAHYILTIKPGESTIVRLRFTNAADVETTLGKGFDVTFAKRRREADEFYKGVIPKDLSEDAGNVMGQSFAGLLWSTQSYHYIVEEWLNGDSAMPPPPRERKKGRNHEWGHLYNADVISMPDKWEYPWYAAWDLAFHCVPLALVDPVFAKEQLVLMLREWYMHPNGQLPAYEWALGDVNPPVHAWAAWRVYKIEKKRRGIGDVKFLERVFHKLLLNFTWWVNRKDTEGMNVFQGGFLGLDNIGVFDRSAMLPAGGHLEQSDGTSWMAMYSLDLLKLALELAAEDPVYEDVASKFWEHFVYIACAMNHLGSDGLSLWDEEDGFFYDALHLPGGEHFPLKVRSLVGLIPLLAVQTLEPELLDRMPDFKMRLEWFIENRPDLTRNLACMRTRGMKERRLLSIAWREQLQRIFQIMLDENEFLSPYGIRGLSRCHREHPYVLKLEGAERFVDYEPG